MQVVDTWRLGQSIVAVVYGLLSLKLLPILLPDTQEPSAYKLAVS